MANQLPPPLRRAGVLGASAVTAVNAPVLAAMVLGVGLTLVAILALTCALARNKTRRDAAYRVLALLLKVATTEQAATGDAIGHPGAAPCHGLATTTATSVSDQPNCPPDGWPPTPGRSTE
jgi:hypothetical protein